MYNSTLIRDPVLAPTAVIFLYSLRGNNLVDQRVDNRALHAGAL